MNLKYKELIDYVLIAGKDLLNNSGEIKDIGTKKLYLTKKDIEIEKNIKNIIIKIDEDSTYYAEENNNIFKDNKSVWIVDPISGTKLFIEGKDNYAIVISHLTNNVVDFALVYNPSQDDLYIGAKGYGVYKNNNKLSIPTNITNKIIFAPSYGYKNKKQIKEIEKNLSEEFELYPSQGSFALNYCMVATGKFLGVISLTKDAFPEFAGCFIANETGLIATNIEKDQNIKHTDRIFICSNEKYYEKIYKIVKNSLK